MRKILLLAAASTWATALSAQSLVQDAADFGVRESIQSVDLSPNGRNVVYLEPTGGTGSIAYIADVDTGNARPFLRSSGGPTEKLQWCSFVSDTRLICRYSGLLREDGVIVPFAKLVAVNSDGTDIKQLGQNSSWDDAWIRQYDGHIIDWLPDEDGAVLMAREYIPEVNQTGSRLGRSREGLGVDRIDTRSMAVKSIERPRRGVDGYVTDGHGNIRLQYIYERAEQGLPTGRSRLEYRPSGSSEWKSLTNFADEKMEPLAIDGSINALYALRKLNGRAALYRIRLTNPATTELVASHPRVDIDDVVRSAHGGRVIGYSLVEDKRQTVYFDQEHKALADSLSKALPGLPLIRFTGASRDGSRSLLFAGSDSDPGRYYLYDRSGKKLSELFLARPQLEQRKIAAVKPISVKVADGTSIPAYLTLPPGKEAKNLPTVVLPHGGPSSRDEWGFDWVAQFLAARGYAVVQPNYRGSAGFGDAWLLQNGFKSWRTSVGDITGTVRSLVSQGIADPNRLAAVGWSYGGYASLQAAALDPSLFKAVAAIAPVTDLDLLKTDSENYTSRKVVAEFVGSGAHIVEGSPLRRAQSIKAPVLLAHGDLDVNVGIDHSVKMESALRAAGTQVELLRYRSLDHQLDDSGARREVLVKIGALLDQTIGK